MSKKKVSKKVSKKISKKVSKKISKKISKKVSKKLPHWTKLLKQLGACDVGRFRRYSTPQAAWKACSDLADIHWLAGTLSGYQLDFTALGCHCRCGLDLDWITAAEYCHLDPDDDNGAHLATWHGREFTRKQWVAFVKSSLPVPDVEALEQAIEAKLEYTGLWPWVPA